MSRNSFMVTLEGDHALTVDQIWPDGDAPENPTSEDVEMVLAEYSVLELIRDWNLEFDIFVA